VLRDDARNQTVPESSIIIEYLGQYYPGGARLIPTDAQLAWQTRLQDRFFDWYVHEPMQKIVTDKLRPQGCNDPHGVEQARALLQTSYGIIEAAIGAKSWIMGADFTLADCAASPALYYANLVAPLGSSHPNTAAYLERLTKRPAFARVIEEAQPYFANFPG
jgi:glutathione S-transferase